MTIQEILEAHLFVPGGFVDPGNHCSCGNYYNNEYFAGSIQLDEHLKHVAEVLDKHMQEREAEARANECETVAQHVGHPSLTEALMERASEIRRKADNNEPE